MPSTLSYPGVYIEEVPSGVRTILGVPTSVTAFVGKAPRGPRDVPVTVNSFGDFERAFGGLWRHSRLGYSVRDFFNNGGAQAVVVRVAQLPSDQELAPARARHEAAVAMKAAVDAAPADPAKKDAVTNFDASALPDEGKKAVTAIKAALADVDAAAIVARLGDELKKYPAALENNAKIAIGKLLLEALAPGVWGRNLRAEIDTAVLAGVGQPLGVTDADVFNITIRDASSGQSESFQNVTLAPSPRQIDDVIRDASRLVTVAAFDPAVAVKDFKVKDSEPALKALTAALVAAGDAADDTAAKAAVTAVTAALETLRTDLLAGMDPASAAERTLGQLRTTTADVRRATSDAAKIAKVRVASESARAVAEKGLAELLVGMGGNDGGDLGYSSFFPAGDFAGLKSLAKAEIFNLLVIPPYKGSGDALDVEPSVVAEAAVFCEQHRAMLLVDPPTSWTDKATVLKDIGADEDKIGTRSKNAALFFPRVMQANPLNDMRVEAFAPSGAVAGVFARTDVERGVWKAPAGLDATLRGSSRLEVKLTDAENGELNPRGVNCLRVMPPSGQVIWGARTLQGDDRLASEWKYVPIRRLALFIEESLFRGTHWVVFEPNDEPLWGSIRLNVGAFMQNLFRQGAFQGRTPRDAYFVKCDRENNPQNTIDQGIVNIRVGFAPLKPAEFVVIQIQQIAGQISV